MLYFLLYLFFEVLVSVEISSVIGPFWTFAEIVVTALVGIFILINFRTTFMQNLTAVSYNCINLEEFQRLNLFTLIGAILLILPGFLSDIIGMLLQFSVFTQMLVNHYGVKSRTCKREKKQKDENVIDVEIISEHTSSK
jgi:UPF0716 family protein affecting phage T7 exclusion